jgi:hypothetical protein
MASIPADVSVQMWRQNIRNRIQHPAPGSPPLVLGNFDRDIQLLRETAPPGLNIDVGSLSLHAIMPLLQEIQNALNVPPAVGQGGRRHRKSRRRRHGRKKTHRRA